MLSKGSSRVFFLLPAGHFHLSHNYADSISVVGRCAFVQTGVMGNCHRDGCRHSRVLKGVRSNNDSSSLCFQNTAIDLWLSMTSMVGSCRSNGSPPCVECSKFGSQPLPFSSGRGQTFLFLYELQEIHHASAIIVGVATSGGSISMRVKGC